MLRRLDDVDTSHIKIETRDHRGARDKEMLARNRLVGAFIDAPTESFQGMKDRPRGIMMYPTVEALLLELYGLEGAQEVLSQREGRSILVACGRDFCWLSPAQARKLSEALANAATFAEDPDNAFVEAPEHPFFTPAVSSSSVRVTSRPSSGIVEEHEDFDRASNLSTRPSTEPPVRPPDPRDEPEPPVRRIVVNHAWENEPEPPQVREEPSQRPSDGPRRSEFRDRRPSRTRFPSRESSEPSERVPLQRESRPAPTPPPTPPAYSEPEFIGDEPDMSSPPRRPVEEEDPDAHGW